MQVVGGGGNPFGFGLPSNAGTGHVCAPTLGSETNGFNRGVSMATQVNQSLIRRIDRQLDQLHAAGGARGVPVVARLFTCTFLAKTALLATFWSFKIRHK